MKGFSFYHFSLVFRSFENQGRLIRILAVFWLGMLSGTVPVVRASDSAPASSGVMSPANRPSVALTKRVVKIFNFNERSEGNLEDLPMHWEKVTLSGFPHYVNGEMDDNIGHPKPSFELTLNGGNLGYLYSVRQIPAFPGSDHKILATFKTEELRYARGYLQTFYMDRYGNPLKDTITYSPLIEPGRPGDPEWQTLSMDLPFTNPEGRFIGIGLFLVQQDQLPQFYDSPVKSYRKDIDAKLWFDNITVIRLPKARLKLEKDCPLYDDTEEIVVKAMVADAATDDLSARLVVTDLAYGNERSFEHPVAVLPPLEAILQGNATSPELISHRLGTLPPGLYRLSLQIHSGSQTIIDKPITLAVLNHNRPRRADDDFGLDLCEEKLSPPKRIATFLTSLAPRWVTLPLWRKDLPISRSNTTPSPTDQLILELNSRQIQILGAWLEVPPELTGQTDLLNPSIWDFLAGKPAWWQSEFAIVLSRHADRIDHWIFGQSRDCWQKPDPRMKPVLKTLGKEFGQFQGQFSFLAAWPAMTVPPSADVSDGYFVKVPIELIPGSFENYFQPWLGGSPQTKNENLWAVLEGQRLDECQMVPAVTDFVTRFLQAKRTGVRHLAAEKLWTKTNAVTEGGFEPNAYYVAYANLIDRLSGLDYVGEIQIDDRHRGELFASDNRAVLVLRDSHPEPYISEITLGEELRAYDMWGRSIPIQTDGKTWQVPYRPIVFIEGISPELARFIASIKFDPEIIPSRFGIQDLRLTFQNTFKQSISGTVRLQGSQYWLFDPSGARFSLTEDREYSLPLKLRYPSNEPIGAKSIAVKFELEARKPITLHLLLPLRLGGSDLQMRVLWFLRDNELIVWQEVLNNGSDWTDLIAYVIAPDQPRQERQIQRLGPEQNAIKEYSLGPWKTMLGKTIRVGFREIRGNRIANELIKLE
jgi:hypothetical protein